MRLKPNFETVEGLREVAQKMWEMEQVHKARAALKECRKTPYMLIHVVNDYGLMRYHKGGGPEEGVKLFMQAKTWEEKYRIAQVWVDNMEESYRVAAEWLEDAAAKLEKEIGDISTANRKQ